ncbi:MAG TPA: hypothetical protein VHT91_07285 [Kofleriaceae bacterium]|jgi:hypothetical protein|nr:hypothetical protein [Kofleriaceae bacterium]
MHTLEAIDLDELVTVTGGADGDPPATPDTSREQTLASSNPGVPARGTQAGLLGG